jgi:hypothetical protein
MRLPWLHRLMLFSFQAMVMLFDKEDARVVKKMVKLFKAFTLSNIVTPDQFTSVRRYIDKLYKHKDSLPPHNRTSPNHGIPCRCLGI